MAAVSTTDRGRVAERDGMDADLQLGGDLGGPMGRDAAAGVVAVGQQDQQPARDLRLLEGLQAARQRLSDTA